MRLVPKLLIGFLVVVVPIICVESVSILQLDQITKPVNDLKSSAKELHTALHLNELAARMQYYDELLTQSARNYAFTEDIKWKERYKSAEPELDKIIKESIELGDKNDHDFFASVDEANLALVEMEYESIRLVDNGHSDDAVRILESKQYWDLKKIYAQGLDNYATRHAMQEIGVLDTHTQSISSLTTTIQSLVRNTTETLVISIPVILILSIVFILMISRRISKPLNRLIESVKRVAAGEFGIEIKINGNDEIHVLAESFNLMSKQLKGYTQKIELDKAKDEFMAMISHELKTPLVPISGYTGLLLTERYGKLTDMQREKIHMIQSSTKSLLKIISDLLDAQKIELGQLRLDVKNENLRKIILDTVEKTKLDAAKSGICITADLADDLHCMCDKNRIEQVISNILFNSFDFCPKNTGRIHITARLQDTFVKIVVTDNGVGLTKEKISKLFVKFYQGDNSTTREHGGTGLGLAVCKGIVENHDGKIWIESEGIDKGTEVHIALPQAKMMSNKILLNDNIEQDLVLDNVICRERGQKRQ